MLRTLLLLLIFSIAFSLNLVAQETTNEINKNEEILLQEFEELENNVESVSIRSEPNPSERDPRDAPEEKEILLYPNPSSGTITIEYEFEELQIRLTNTLGQTLGTLEYNEVEKDIVQIDLGDHSAGTYFLQFATESGTQLEKVILIRL